MDNATEHGGIGPFQTFQSALVGQALKLPIVAFLTTRANTKSLMINNLYFSSWMKMLNLTSKY